MIVEVGEESGTRHMGWEAIHLGRPVLFPEGFLKRTAATWPEETTMYGAFGFDRDALRRVLEELPPRRPTAAAERAADPY